mgnify:CR=1 FL=1
MKHCPRTILEQSITSPITETKKLLEIEKRLYEIVIRGANVVHIDPPGVRGPFYQRSDYRTGQTRWRKVERFIPCKAIDW